MREKKNLHARKKNCSPSEEMNNFVLVLNEIPQKYFRYDDFH